VSLRDPGHFLPLFVMISTPLVSLHALGLIAMVSALRHYEDDMAHENLAADAKLVLNRTRPLTPRLSAEDLADLRQMKVPRASMAQLKETCNESKFLKTGDKLGEGAFGAVYKVRSNTWLSGVLESAISVSGVLGNWFESASQYYYYAMKVPLEGDEEAEDAAEHEISVMAAAKDHQCMNVLPLLDEDPCVDGERMINAFVTKLLPWDMDKWQREYEVNAECFDVVFDAVRSGLDCMHEAGYMHGDLKPDNVLFEDFDADGCPKGIQLADFGLSHELGKPHMKFPKQYYNISWHEAGTVFNGVTDPFKLTTKVKVNGKYKMHYVVDSRLDECSFAMLMYELFNERVPSIQEHLGKGACGPMGPERGLMMP